LRKTTEKRRESDKIHFFMKCEELSLSGGEEVKRGPKRRERKRERPYFQYGEKRGGGVLLEEKKKKKKESILYTNQRGNQSYSGGGKEIIEKKRTRGRGHWTLVHSCYRGGGRTLNNHHL